MKDYSKNLIRKGETLKTALKHLGEVPMMLTLFVLDDEDRLVGTLTDGDIRRNILLDKSTDGLVEDFMFTNFRYIRADYDIKEIEDIRRRNIKIIPILDNDNRIVRIVNFSEKRSLLPIDAVIMAGGKGTRLRPLTLDTPKPLLKVNGKPIIEYNIDRLNLYGIHYLTITVKYLGKQISDYFENGADKNMSIKYVEEDEPLGTIGALSLMEEFHNPYVLVMNSDLLTDIDYELFFKALEEQDGDMIVATTPYEVKIPYGVIEVDGEQITNHVEKPTYTYYSNAGIYIFKKEYLDLIPHNSFFNATDLLEKLVALNKKVLHYPILGYWLDIGKPHDFEKAQNDVKHIKF